MGNKSGQRSTLDSPRKVEQSVQEDSGTLAYPAFFEALNLPVSLINRQYTYIWVNSCFGAAHGQKPEDIMGRTVETLWGQEIFSRVIKKKLDRCFQGMEVRDEAWIQFPALGSRWCELVYSPCPLAGTGAVLAMVVAYDLTERKEMERQVQAHQEQILLQYDLALKLAGTSSLEEALILCLATALRVAHVESGAIYLKNPRTDTFELATATGLPKEFKEKVSLAEAELAAHAFATAGNPTYLWPHKEAAHPYRTEVLEEGLRFLVALPVLHNNEVIACVNLDSGTLDALSPPARATLELIALQLGAIFARIQTEKELQNDVEHRKKAEAALEVKSQSLEEANAALKVLLKQREEERRELEEKLVGNLKQLVIPYVENLRRGRLEPSQQAAVDLIEGNLKEILSPFLNNLRPFNFTPRQLEIIAFIKEGKTTKGMAEALHVGKAAIDTQRFLIRKKLGLNNEKTNLRSYLLSLA